MHRDVVPPSPVPSRKRGRGAATAVLAALLLAGCAAGTWQKGDGSSPDAVRDEQRCLAEARAAGYGGTSMVAQLELQTAVDNCMFRRGYHKGF